MLSLDATQKACKETFQYNGLNLSTKPQGGTKAPNRLQQVPY